MKKEGMRVQEWDKDEDAFWRTMFGKVVMGE